METEKSLANIITTSNKINFDLPANKCKDLSCMDETLPTLIIGYELAKKYIKGFNILKKYYPNQNIYWTFKKTERAVDYESGLKEFYETVINDCCDKYQYSFIDIIKVDFTTAKKLVKYLLSDDEKLIYNENGRFLYVFSEKYKTVFGYSLSTTEFFGLEPRKIVNLIKRNENNRFIEDFTNIPYEVKYIMGEKIDKYMAMYGYFTD